MSAGMLNASQTVLTADEAYIRLLEAQSTWPLHYHFRTPQPSCLASPVHGLNAPKGVGPAQIESYNRLLPINLRMQMRASQNRPQRALYGTAPYTLRGNGILRHVDVSSDLIMGTAVTNDLSRLASERDYGRFDFVRLPDALSNLPVDTRLGALTRMAPQYQPRD